MSPLLLYYYGVNYISSLRLKMKAATQTYGQVINYLIVTNYKAKHNTGDNY